MADDDEIRIRAELEGHLARDLRVTADAADELGDEAQQTAIQLEIMGAAARGTSRDVKDLGDDTRSSAQRLDDLNAAFGRSRRSHRQFKRDNEQSTKALSRFKQMVERTNNLAFNPAALLKTYMIPALVTALSLAVSALSALGAAAVGAVAGLAPLLVLVQAMPSALIAGAQAMAAVKVGMMGVTDAVTALLEGDPEKIAEAFNKLSVHGNILARTVAGLAGPLRQLKLDTQNALAPGFTDAVEVFGDRIPMLRRELVGTAGALSRVASSAAEVAQTHLFRKEMSGILSANTVAIEHAGGAGVLLFQALLHVADAFAPVLVLMSQAARRAAVYIERVTEVGNKSGAMGEAFHSAWQLAQELGGVLADVAVTLFNIGRESGVMSSYLGSSLKEAADGWRAWSESVAGKESIRDWFASSVPVVREMVGLIGDLVKMMAGVGSHTDLLTVLQKLRSDTLPALASLMDGVSGSYGPAFVDVLTAMANALNALPFSPLLVVLQAVTTVLSGLTTIFSALPGPVKAAAAAVLALVFALRLMQFGKSLAANALAPMVTTLGAMRTSSRAAAGGLTGWAGAAARAKGAAVGLRGAAGGLMGAMGGPWGIALAGAAIGIGVWAQKQAEAKARAQELTDTLNAQTGALTENSNQAIARMLLDEGWDNDKLSEYNLTMQDVVTAMGQGKDAVAELGKTATDEAGHVDLAWGGLDQLFSGGLNGGAQLKSDLLDISDAVGEAQSRQETLNSVNEAGEYANLSNARAMDASAYAAQGLMSNVDSATGALNGQAGATDLVIRKTKELNDLMISNGRTYIGFRQTVDSTRDVLFKGAMTLDVHTKAGQDNKLAMYDLVEAAAAVTNQAQRQKALKEAEGIIRNWGEAAGMTKGQIDKLVDSMIKTEETVQRLDGLRANITITANGLNKIITDADRAGDAISDLVASQGQVQVVPRGKKKRRHGGAVWPGESFHVGEVGPELLLTKAGVSVVGRGGPETRRFDQPGMILPTERYREVQHAITEHSEREVPAASAPRPPVRSESSGGPEIEPHIHLHFEGGSPPSVAEARRAGRAAAREFQREMRERGIGGES